MKEVMMTDYRGLTWDPTFLRCWRSFSNPCHSANTSVFDTHRLLIKLVIKFFLLSYQRYDILHILTAVI